MIIIGRIIGMFFLLVGVGLLGTCVFGGFNSEFDTGQVFIGGMAGICSSMFGGYISLETLKSSR